MDSLPQEAAFKRFFVSAIRRDTQLAQNLIFTLPRTPFAQVEEILKHLTVMDASEVEMSTSLRLDRLAFREKTSVQNGFRPSLHWESNQPTPEYRRLAQSGRISR